MHDTLEELLSELEATHGNKIRTAVELIREESYRDGYNNGQEGGYRQGHRDGDVEGYTNGYRKGYANGRSHNDTYGALCSA